MDVRPVHPPENVVVACICPRGSNLATAKSSMGESGNGIYTPIIAIYEEKWRFGFRGPPCLRQPLAPNQPPLMTPDPKIRLAQDPVDGHLRSESKWLVNGWLDVWLDKVWSTPFELSVQPGYPHFIDLNWFLGGPRVYRIGGPSKFGGEQASLSCPLGCLSPVLTLYRMGTRFVRVKALKKTRSQKRDFGWFCKWDFHFIEVRYGEVMWGVLRGHQTYGAWKLHLFPAQAVIRCQKYRD